MTNCPTQPDHIDIHMSELLLKPKQSNFISVVQSYINYYASDDSHTARAKRLDLQHFVEFLKSYFSYKHAENIQLKDWDHSSIQRFVDHCLSQGQAPATVSRRLATIKHMGRTFAEKFPGFVNPAKEVKAPKIIPNRPKALDSLELEKINTKASLRKNLKSSFTRLRNQVIFEFMLDTGLRADEVRLLRISQLELSSENTYQWIKNVRTKGRRFRNVYITSKIQAALSQYLKAREQELKPFFNPLTIASNRNLPLFISTYKATSSNPDSFLMGAKTLWRAINELSTDTKLHPHLLRHSYALDLLNSSNDIRLVAQALGHSDVRTTMRYTERKEEEVAQALERARSKN